MRRAGVSYRRQPAAGSAACRTRLSRAPYYSDHVVTTTETVALRSPRVRGAVRTVAAIAALAVVYYLAARLGLALAYLDGAVGSVWPPVGVGIAALYLFGLRLWPGIVIGDLLVADFSTPIGTVVAQTVGNTVAVVLAAMLLRRLARGREGLERVGDVVALVGCAIVAAGVSALVGPPSLWLGGVIEREQLDDVFRTWFLSDLSGALVVTPALLAWAGATGRITRRYAVEGLALLAALVLIAELPPQRDVPYVVFPLLILSALRLGPRGAATAIFVVSSITVWNTANNSGPFVRDSITQSLLTTQLFIAVSALTSLVLAAVTAERRRAEAALRTNEERLRDLATEQAALRRVATLVASEVDPDEVFQRVSEEAARLLGTPAGTIVRYEGDEGSAVVVGGWAEEPRRLIPVGSTVPLDGDTVISRVYRTGEPQRVTSYEESKGELARTLRSLGYRSAVAAPVNLGGRLWGAVVVGVTAREPLDERAEQRLCDFADLVAQAIANADAHEQLAASRARIVEVGDAERRRLERNLHDGAQQRLVALALQLRMVRAKLLNDSEGAGRLLETANVQLNEALEELRELARGIHPAVLTDHGLSRALEVLVERAPVRVDVAELPRERLPEPVEAAAYYVVAEAVTNAAKYAQASAVAVSVERSDSTVLVRVADDGVGGADPTGGSGLRGLADRLEALGGRLSVDSSPGAGTRVEAELPL
jgi:signal transduction histidine kinase